MSVISTDAAQRFAKSWVAAWNAHDLDAILSHYTENFTFSSPLIPRIAGVPSGTLVGKPAIRAYWTLGLSLLPNLRFELLHVLCGIEGVTLVYRGHRGIVAEVFHFNREGQVEKALACYAEPP